MAEVKRESGLVAGRRYIMFAWGDYYPNGAMTDAVGTYDTIEAAMLDHEPLGPASTHNAEIWDLQTLTPVKLWRARPNIQRYIGIPPKETGEWVDSEEV